MAGNPLPTSLNAGVSLQALMALLGHVSAEMSLRYGRLFDATVRTEYERALTLAKQRLGTHARRPHRPAAGRHRRQPTWKDSPVIKSRLAGGFCLRAPAQGACAYANICEHCPNFRTDATYLPVLAAHKPTPKRSPKTPKPAAGSPKPTATINSSPASTPHQQSPSRMNSPDTSPEPNRHAPTSRSRPSRHLHRCRSHRQISRATLYRTPPCALSSTNTAITQPKRTPSPDSPQTSRTAHRTRSHRRPRPPPRRTTPPDRTARHTSTPQGLKPGELTGQQRNPGIIGRLKLRQRHGRVILLRVQAGSHRQRALRHPRAGASGDIHLAQLVQPDQAPQLDWQLPAARVRTAPCTAITRSVNRVRYAGGTSRLTSHELTTQGVADCSVP